MVSEVKLVELSVQVHGNLIFPKAGCSLKIQHRSRRHRVRETDFAALQTVLRAIECDLTFQNIDPSQKYWLGRGAPEPQIGVARKTERCRLHLQLRRRINPDVQANAVQQRVCLRE